MDVHARFRTESHQDVVGRFNERFLLSLAQAANTLVVDDELNILPLSSSIRNIQRFQPLLDEAGERVKDPVEIELDELKSSLRDTPPVGNLVEQTRTLDQAKALLGFMESVADKTLRSTVVLTAGRGRGKSAALGLAIAGAVAFGYSNIFVTAPSPENLKTLFEMVFKGFDAFAYKEHADYEVVQSLNPDFNHAIVRVNIFHGHRQTIQYIQPGDYAKLGQAELLVIDEAAAIPLPLVKSLLGPYLVFMSSTINGYEGTGRSLSLKLVKQLRTQSAPGAAAAAAAAAASAPAAATAVVGGASAAGRTLREVTLDEPIRYARDDPIERWLNDLLCLNCTATVPRLLGAALPHPSSCELYYVERDTLFSAHKASESFLQRMMALYVASHYKNSPNDLQLMSDAPAHHLFVLLGPVGSTSALPDILAVVQVCLEGGISRESVARALARGERANGDLVPWLIAQQYSNQEFASLSGARIVRIATNPEVARFGYGSRAIELLSAYYEGKITNLQEDDAAGKGKANKKKASASAAAAASNGEAAMEDDEAGSGEPSQLLSEVLAPRKSLPPLLTSLQDRQPEPLHYMGVSYGLTQELLNFWTKARFTPLYLRLTPNDLTGEHTCVMIRPLQAEGSAQARLETLTHAAWLPAFHADFLCRFEQLLSFNFAKFHPSLALSLLVDPKHSVLESGLDLSDRNNNGAEMDDGSDASPWLQASRAPISQDELSFRMTQFDLRRLESYASNLVDYHLVLDLVPNLASLFFRRRFGRQVRLSHVQAALLLALGLQHKDVADCERELGLPQSQLLAQFNKSVRKLVARLKEIETEQARKEVQSEQEAQAKAAIKAKSASAAGASASAAAAAAPSSSSKSLTPLARSLESELSGAGDAAVSALKKKQRAMLDGINLAQYAITASDEAFEGAGVQPSGTLSVAASAAKKEAHREYLKNKADGAQKRTGISGGHTDAQGSAKKKKKH
jgi:N-acetyltransferase 10